MRDVNAHRQAGGGFSVEDATPMEPSGAVVPVPTPRGGTGTIRSGNEPERPGTTGGLFEPLAAFLERTANLPPPSWLLDELVPDAGRLFIVSAPNAGKTFLALVLAKVAAGTGRLVFLVLEEGGARATGERFRNLGIGPAAPIYVAHLKGVALRDPGVRQELAAELKAHPNPIMVLDPFSSVFDGDENDTRQMNQAKGYLEELARANPRALLVLCHHTSKAGERGDGPPMYAARGSSILSGWADVQLNLKHHPMPKGSGKVAFVATVEKHRDGERGYRALVTVPLGGGEVTFDKPPAEQDHAERILKAATDQPDLSRDALARAVGGRKGSVLTEIDRLTAEGALEKRGKGYFVKDVPSDLEDTAP